MATENNTQTTPAPETQQPPAPEQQNMHDACPIWQDTPCCCEPEPRWQAVEDERERDASDEL
jgi:hypothetical protein